MSIGIAVQGGPLAEYSMPAGMGRDVAPPDPDRGARADVARFLPLQL